VRVIPDTVISGQHNPATCPYWWEPLGVLCIRRKVIIVYLHRGSCLPQGIGHITLPETAIEKKDERVYAAFRSSSHRMASSISGGGRS
jgi:hypothetical protein